MPCEKVNYSKISLAKKEKKVYTMGNVRKRTNKKIGGINL